LQTFGIRIDWVSSWWYFQPILIEMLFVSLEIGSMCMQFSMVMVYPLVRRSSSYQVFLIVNRAECPQSTIRRIGVVALSCYWFAEFKVTMAGSL